MYKIKSNYLNSLSRLEIILNRPYSRYWTVTTLQLRFKRGFSNEKKNFNDIHRKLVPVQYQEYNMVNWHILQLAMYMQRQTSILIKKNVRGALPAKPTK